MTMTGLLRATLCGAFAAFAVFATAAPAAAQADRINALEGQVRNLTGQVEELTHQLQVLQGTLQRMQEDNEYRFSELEGGTAKRPASEPAQAAAAPEQQPQQQLGAPPAPLGQVVVEGGAGAQPLDLSSLAGDQSLPAADGAPADTQTAMAQPDLAPAPQVAVPQPTGDPRADYDAAYRLFASNRYDAAELAFRQFLQSYPLDPRAAEAQYWIGLSLFVRGDFQHAAEQFLASYKQYPKGRFAVESLLQLGQSQAGLGRPDEACKSYAVALKNYPQMANALKQRIINAKATAGC